MGRWYQLACRVGTPTPMLPLRLRRPRNIIPCDMPSALFSPIRLADLELANRIVVSPMCQYSADDGVASDWHINHLGMLANSGAGLVIAEMTDVERRGRISHGCLGIYSDDCEAALARVVAHCRRFGTAKIGVQTRPCRPQGLGAAPVGGQRAARAGRRSLADHRAVGDPVRRRLAGAARDDGGRYRARARSLRDRRQARGARRLRRHRAARRARLPAAQLRLADIQQAHRRLWRPARRAHALPARDRRGGARRRSERHAARRTHDRQRLGRGRPHARRRGDLRQGAQSRRARLRRASPRAASPPTRGRPWSPT